jgi:hypothetical protein
LSSPPCSSYREGYSTQRGEGRAPCPTQPTRKATPSVCLGILPARTHTCKLLAASEALAGWGRRPVVLVPSSPISGKHISHATVVPSPHNGPPAPRATSCPRPTTLSRPSLRLLAHDFHVRDVSSLLLVVKISTAPETVAAGHLLQLAAESILAFPVYRGGNFTALLDKTAALIRN